MASSPQTARKRPAVKAKARTAAPVQQPKRRGRPPKIDQEQLLAIARDVFLSQGILATTQEVAQRAGISEGTLFHRFRTKEGLFRAAMALPADDVPQLFGEAVEGISELGLEEALEKLSGILLDLGRVAVPLMMMSWSNPSHYPQGVKDPNHLRYREFVKKLAGYFETQMELGRLRRMDAEVVARSLLGSLFHYSMVRACSSGDTAWLMPEGMFKRGIIDLLLNGARPREAIPSAPQEPGLRAPPRRAYSQRKSAQPKAK